MVDNIESFRRRYEKAVRRREVGGILSLGAFLGAVCGLFFSPGETNFMLMHSAGFGGLGFFGVTVLEGVHLWTIRRQLALEEELINQFIGIIEKDGALSAHDIELLALDREYEIVRGLLFGVLARNALDAPDGRQTFARSLRKRWRAEKMARTLPSVLICTATAVGGVVFSMLGAELFSSTLLTGLTAVAAVNPLIFVAALSLMTAYQVKNFVCAHKRGGWKESRKHAVMLGLIGGITLVGATAMIASYLAATTAAAAAVTMTAVCFPALGIAVAGALGYLIYKKLHPEQADASDVATAEKVDAPAKSVAHGESAVDRCANCGGHPFHTAQRFAGETPPQMAARTEAAGDGAEASADETPFVYLYR